MNIGIAASVTLILCFIKDYIKLIFDREFVFFNSILGLGILIMFFVILKVDLCDKVKNKENLRMWIDLCTAVSVILFGVENAILEFAKNTEEKIEVGIMLGTLSVLCVGLFVWTFFKKKNRNYNVD